MRRCSAQPSLRSTGAADLDPATGGNASFRLNAGSTIYGAAIIQGPGKKANGHAALVSAPKILEDISDKLSKSTVYGLPASWLKASLREAGLDVLVLVDPDVEQVKAAQTKTDPPTRH